MPIVGAVLTLSEDRILREQLLSELERNDRVEIGQAVGPHLPIVVETADGEEDEAFWRELAETPGVLRHVVAWASLNDALGPEVEV